MFNGQAGSRGRGGGGGGGGSGGEGRSTRRWSVSLSGLEPRAERPTSKLAGTLQVSRPYNTQFYGNTRDTRNTWYRTPPNTGIHPNTPESSLSLRRGTGGGPGLKEVEGYGACTYCYTATTKWVADDLFACQWELPHESDSICWHARWDMLP